MSALTRPAPMVRPGLAEPGARPYLRSMSFLRFFSPLRAYRDLRFFLAKRRPHELGFFALSLAITWTIIFFLMLDSKFTKAYHRDIVYVQQWPANRTDAEIIAQQKIDGPIEAKAKADQEKREAEVRASFKKVDDKLKKFGL